MTKKTLGLLTLTVAYALTAGCSSTGPKKFDRIVPGMSSSDVKNAMDQGPTRFENIANTSFATWYWGDNYCVLFKDDKVVAKDSALAGDTASAKGVEYTENRKAQCLAPGQTSKATADRTINIPGVGTVHLPGDHG
jgi:hypothetical protein